jgi:signal transduction histidine kinase
LLDGYSGNMLNQQQRRYVETIAACNDQEIALINDLLLVAQLDAGVVVLQTEPIELDAFTRDLVTAINQDKPVEHDVKPPAPVVYIGHDPLTVPADKHYLRLVICQLLGNARKYARQGVPLNITVSLRRSDSKVLIVIHDNGSGIASKYQPMLYQKFVNPADERYTPGGIGLGLHWSKRIIELHGGSLRVATRTGRGTTATISLPLA